jgi:putative sigma-54 modulation protein
MVPIEVRSKSPFIEREVVEFAESRIHFALDRFRHLRRLLIFIEDVNGPKGGADKRCHIVAEFAFATVVAQETQSTWQGAVARVIHRIAQTAARRLQRVTRAPAHRRPQLSSKQFNGLE